MVLSQHNCLPDIKKIKKKRVTKHYQKDKKNKNNKNTVLIIPISK
jgi:hypothetical protein